MAIFTHSVNRKINYNEPSCTDVFLAELELTEVHGKMLEGVELLIMSDLGWSQSDGIMAEITSKQPGA